MTARLRLDPTRCAGHGICALILGEGVDLDQWGFPVPDGRVVDDGRPRRRALRAVAACPSGALSLEEDPPEARLPVTPGRSGAPLLP